ncbi:hypothetical protein [Thomasclavelia cocleata]|uniref:hypothetical protein n=1 Tax=Thomasclavelia cocleata TaxID=69824 RepID=UPI002433175F|nr:hypothetical protein [Thomasclavelia cocleata]
MNYLLNDNYCGTLNKSKVYPTYLCLTPTSDIFIKVIYEYQKFMVVEGCLNKTLICRLHDAHFFVYLEEIDIQDLKKLNNQMLSNYLLFIHFQNRKSSGITGLRKFIM